MRFLIVVKATKDTEAGKGVREDLCRHDDVPRGTGKWQGCFSMLGLQPTSKGWRIQY